MKFGEPSQRCKFQEFLSSFPGVSPKGEVSPIQQRVILPRARFAQILNWPGEGHGTCLTEDKEKYSSTVKGSFFFQSPALTIELKGRKQSKSRTGLQVGFVAGEEGRSLAVDGLLPHC